VSKRILIVDDEENIREVAAASLELVGGWEVLTADSGGSGIVRAVTDRPDAILLDVMMPDMDGPSAFRVLRTMSATEHIPVILLTAKVQAGDQRRFSDLGLAAVIAKPFDPMALPGQVAQALGWAP
jgi:CheY-like chemotaxis protein